MAHNVLAEKIDAMLHVQFLYTWRYLLHLLVVALLMTHSRRRDVGIHRRRNMGVDCIHAMQSVENFWSSNIGVSRSKGKSLDDKTHSKMYRPECNNDWSCGLNGSTSAGVISMNRPRRHQFLVVSLSAVGTTDGRETHHAEDRSKQHLSLDSVDPRSSCRHYWQSLLFGRPRHTPTACCRFGSRTQ
jgi:hypothetical protein